MQGCHPLLRPLTDPNRIFKLLICYFGSLKGFDPDGCMNLRMESGKEVSFNSKEMRHFDQTQESIQNLSTLDCAYVSVSRVSISMLGRSASMREPISLLVSQLVRVSIASMSDCDFPTGDSARNHRRERWRMSIRTIRAKMWPLRWNNMACGRKW